MEAVKEMESVEKIQAINKTSWIQRMKSYKRTPLSFVLWLSLIHILPISLHEEDPAYIKQPGVNQGKVSEQLNYGGASYMAEAVMVKRDCELAVKTGAKVDIQHISSGVAVDYVKEAKDRGANVYAEASPHHFTLTEEAVLKYGTLARMNPPLRTEEDRQRIIKGLQEGTIEIIATDHAPHSKDCLLYTS